MLAAGTQVGSESGVLKPGLTSVKCSRWKDEDPEFPLEATAVLCEVGRKPDGNAFTSEQEGKRRQQHEPLSQATLL